MSSIQISDTYPIKPSRGKFAVGFAMAATEVQTIPADMASWAKGECAASPSEQELNDMDNLAQRASAEAAKEEKKRPSRFREDFDAPFQYVPSVRHSANNITQAPSTRTKPLTYFNHSPSSRVAPPVVRRKPLSRDYSFVKKSPAHFPVTQLAEDRGNGNPANQYPAVLVFQPAFHRAATTHSFDDFLTSEHDKSWNELDAEKAQKNDKKPL